MSWFVLFVNFQDRYLIDGVPSILKLSRTCTAKAKIY